jgi:hypothetical protein
VRNKNKQVKKCTHGVKILTRSTETDLRKWRQWRQSYLGSITIAWVGYLGCPSYLGGYPHMAGNSQVTKVTTVTMVMGTPNVGIPQPVDKRMWIFMFSARYCCSISTKTGMCRQILVNLANINLMKIRSAVLEMLHPFFPSFIAFVL